MENYVHVPAALELWAAEHSDQLSKATLDEVRSIALILEASVLAQVPVEAPPDQLLDRLGEVFTGSREKRARNLVPIVAGWMAKRPSQLDTSQLETSQPKTVVDDEHGERQSQSDTALTNEEPAQASEDVPVISLGTDVASSEPLGRGPRFEPPAPLSETPESGKRESATAEDIAAPAFLRSDRVDQEDDERLYGPRRPWFAIVGTLMLAALLGAAAFLGWTLYQRSTEADPAESAGDPLPTVAPESEPAPTAAPEPASAAPPAPTEVPTPGQSIQTSSYWADTTPILNSGSSLILSSTYVVSPSNRAVLTGHTAGITGIVISDDGRVLTSGADRRLVDWGADVTLANPDVLNVTSALTVLERTVDQRVIAGDVDGMVTILDLVNGGDPVLLPVHDVAISAATELADGRLAVASVDGDVSVFDLADPETVLELPHDGEVTAVVGLPDSSVVTASVDGAVRVWPSDGSAFSEITGLGAPVTALAMLSDGRIAAASVTGDIQVFAADGGGLIELPGHVGAVRSLFEAELPGGSKALASGGDDTTIRLWSLDDNQELLVLEGHGDIISGLDALPDGRLVSTSGDGTGRVWDLTVAPTAPVIAPHNWNLSALHPWGNDLFVTGGIDGHVVLASTAETSEPQPITQHDAPIVGLGVLQTGDIVSLDASSLLRVNQSSGDVTGLVEFELSPGATALAVRESLGVVTGHADGSVRFHDFAEETGVVAAHDAGVNDVIVLSSGLVVSAGQDNVVRVIDPENPEEVVTFELHTTPVDVVVELPDGRIASAGVDGMYVWTVEDLADGHVRLNGQRSRTLSLVALPGERLISTGDDGRVRLWDLSTPEAEPETLIDIPGVVNPYLIEAENGLFVAGAARGYVVFTPN